MSLVVLVTRTSRGLGAHLRAHLERRGHVVYGSSRRGGDDPRTLTLDVTDEASCEAAVRRVLTHEGRIDALINNAGSHLYGAAIETTASELRAQMELNFHGPVHMTRAVLPHLLERRQGRVLTMSSVSGRFATPLTSAYTASKFALEGWMEALRLEVGPFGVHVCTLEPAYLRTGTTAAAIEEVAQGHPLFERARAAARRRAIEEGDRGLPLERVSEVVDRLLTAPRPSMRHSVDGLATRLSWLHALLPSATYEANVLRQTAPELLEA